MGIEPQTHISRHQRILSDLGPLTNGLPERKNRSRRSACNAARNFGYRFRRIAWWRASAQASLAFAFSLSISERGERALDRAPRSQAALVELEDPVRQRPARISRRRPAAVEPPGSAAIALDLDADRPCDRIAALLGDAGGQAR